MQQAAYDEIAVFKQEHMSITHLLDCCVYGGKVRIERYLEYPIPNLHILFPPENLFRTTQDQMAQFVGIESKRR